MIMFKRRLAPLIPITDSKDDGFLFGIVDCIELVADYSAIHAAARYIDFIATMIPMRAVPQRVFSEDARRAAEGARLDVRHVFGITYFHYICPLL